MSALASRLAGVGALAVLLGALGWLAHTGKRVSTAQAAGGIDAVFAAYAFVLAAGLAMAVLPRWRRHALLVVSVLGLVWLIGAAFVPVALYCALLTGLARSRMRLRFQVGCAALAWSSLPLLRAYALPIEWQNALVATMIVWAQLAYGSLYLLVERARWSEEKPTVVDDLAYLLALPRMAEPFFQPISPRDLWASEATTPALGLSARGLALGLAGGVLGVLAMRLHAAGPPRALGEPGHVVFSVLTLYAFVAGQIFVSIALFRLLGFDLSSGMRQPFLSRSFRDWFRRWNHYVRDAIVSLFLFPLQGFFRRRMGRTAARITAAYLSIFIGSFLLNDLLVPMVTSIDPIEGAGRSATLRRMIVFIVYWSAIVLPKAGLEITAAQARATPARRAFEIARFLSLFLLLWWLSHRLAVQLPL